MRSLVTGAAPGGIVTDIDGAISEAIEDALEEALPDALDEALKDESHDEHNGDITPEAIADAIVDAQEEAAEEAAKELTLEILEQRCDHHDELIAELQAKIFELEAHEIEEEIVGETESDADEVELPEVIIEPRRLHWYEHLPKWC